MIKTFRSKLIRLVIGSSLVFFLLSYTAQSTYQAFREADFSEQETTITRGCGKASLSNLLFSTYNCSEGVIADASEGKILGGTTEKTKKIEGMSREKTPPTESATFLETTKATAHSQSPYLLLTGLVLAGLSLNFFLKGRRGRSRPMATVFGHNQNMTGPLKSSSRQPIKTLIHIQPEESVRLLLLDFNQQLPRELQRQTHETLTDWMRRIQLTTSLTPYLITRYASRTDLPEERDVIRFEADLTSYLSLLHHSRKVHKGGF
ncbi:hypothetical protein [Exiguobacterium sp. s193]|uniref:hypothetical protein n=1 Tax=Exiguobacterium sp. s193 TaxID=2751207 RepID=UPI001BEC0E3B|nr:hypothetical protein [Exiguobacterium sp. s193]